MFQTQSTDLPSRFLLPSTQYGTRAQDARSAAGVKRRHAELIFALEGPLRMDPKEGNCD